MNPTARVPRVDLSLRTATRRCKSRKLRAASPRPGEQVLREAIFQDNTGQLKMPLPPAMKAVLSTLARQRTTDATTLARIWLAERLEKELKPG